MINLDRCLALAKTIVWDAVALLHWYYQPTHGKNLDLENNPESPVTAADLAVNHQVLAQLQSVFSDPTFGYLSEEKDKLNQWQDPLPQPWIWVLDPIDGTRDFIERTGQFTLHLALLHRHTPVLALLAVPAEGKLYTAIKGQGTFVELREPWSGSVPKGDRVRSVKVSSRYNLEHLKLVIGRNGRYPRFAAFLDEFPVQQRIWGGSLGYKIVQILEQKGDVYLSLSGRSAPKDWDLAAPDLILKEAGGKFSREDGLPLRYNQGDLNQWGCLIGSNGTCHSQLCDAANRILNGWIAF